MVSRKNKEIILVVCIMFPLTFGRYMSWNFSIFYREYLSKHLDMTNKQALSLSEWYLWPNVIIDIFGGLMIDRIFGIKVAAVLFSSLELLGSIIFYIGYKVRSYWTVCFSQLLIGIGCESLFIIQVAYLMRYFNRRQFILLGCLFCYGDIIIMIGDVIMHFSHIHHEISLILLLPLPSIVPFLVSILGIFFLPSTHMSSESSPKSSSIQELLDTSVNTDNQQKEQQIITKPSINQSVRNIITKNFHLAMICCFVVYFTCILADIRFFVPMKYLLSEKYLYIDDFYFILLNPFYGLCFLPIGFLLDLYLKSYIYWNHLAVLCLIISNLLLVMTFVTPLLFIALQVVSISFIKLIMFCTILHLVPSNEYACSVGFIRGVSNIAIGISDTLFNNYFNTIGLMSLGVINICIVNIGAIVSLVIISAKLIDYDTTGD